MVRSAKITLNDLNGMRIFLIKLNPVEKSAKSSINTLNGSTFSHVIDLDRSFIFSGSDSGTATNIKNRSNIAIAVAKAITKFSL